MVGLAGVVDDDAVVFVVVEDASSLSSCDFFVSDALLAALDGFFCCCVDRPPADSEENEKRKTDLDNAMNTNKLNCRDSIFVFPKPYNCNDLATAREDQGRSVDLCLVQFYRFYSRCDTNTE